MEEFFEPPAAGNIRGHNFKVRQPRFHLVRRKAAFAARSAGPLNRLLPHLAEATTVWIAWMPTGVSSSLTSFAPTPFSVFM